MEPRMKASGPNMDETAKYVGREVD
jgi:hypothetical protein